MNIFIHAILSCIIILSLNLPDASAQEPDAEHLAKEIKSKGAREVIAELMSDDQWTEFEKVCDKIETGNREWLEVARLLAPGSDAAAAESLTMSVARALPKSPREVLALIALSEHDHGKEFTIDNICVSPYIENEPGVEERHLLTTSNVLESTDTSNDPHLNCLRLKCLENIRGIIDNAKKHGIWKEKE
ncbi:MAG: hypothetical protein VB050_11085 [Geobacteraceae bacterium]|nr:hypothetical protein [Geobacteraceae bacterium]